jgi:hypothetical protein
MAQRAAIRTDDRHAAPQPVECARCGATAEVVKFSAQHTSVQWTAAAVHRCAEFRAAAAEGTRSALVEGCAALRDSIDTAVASGRLAVSPPAYEQTENQQTEYQQTEYERPDRARLLPGHRGGGDPRDRRRVLVRA